MLHKHRHPYSIWAPILTEFSKLSVLCNWKCATSFFWGRTMTRVQTVLLRVQPRFINPGLLTLTSMCGSDSYELRIQQLLPSLPYQTRSNTFSYKWPNFLSNLVQQKSWIRIQDPDEQHWVVVPYLENSLLAFPWENLSGDLVLLVTPELLALELNLWPDHNNRS